MLLCLFAQCARLTGIRVLPAIVMLIAFAGGLSKGHGQDVFEDWQEIQIGQRGDLTVRLRVKRRATLADENWLAIEFENQSNRDIELVHPKYGIRYEAYDLQTQKLNKSGDLGSGNLFWRQQAVRHGPPQIAKQSVWRVVDQPSSVSGALLGLPPQGGLLIKAELFAHVEVKNEGVVVDSLERCPFEFRWQFPDEAGFEKMRSRLKNLLESSPADLHSAYMLRALLKIPNVAKVASAEELLEALDASVHPNWGRAFLLKHIDEHFANNPVVANRFRERLAARDKAVVEDLKKTPRIWSPSMLKLLIVRFETEPTSSRAILDVLDQHGPPQKHNEQLARRLSAALLKQPAFLPMNRRGVREPKNVGAWRVMDALKMLSKTHDQAVVARIAPYLDNKERGLNPRLLATLMTQMPPLRVCDAALEAILTILDGDAQAAAAPSPIRSVFTRVSVDEWEIAADQHRDKEIEKLKRRLEESRIGD